MWFNNKCTILKPFYPIKMNDEVNRTKIYMKVV